MLSGTCVGYILVGGGDACVLVLLFVVLALFVLLLCVASLHVRGGC